MKRLSLAFLGVILMVSLAFGWGGDIQIYNGKINCFDVDYAMDGTMFVAFQAQGEDTIQIYTSTDHGSSWSWLDTLNTNFSYYGTSPRDDLRRIRLIYDELNAQLFVFFVDSDGYLFRWRLPLSDLNQKGLRISDAPILEGSFDVTYNLNDGRLFATWTEGNSAGDKIYIKYSDDNGKTWTVSTVATWGVGGDTRRSITFGPPANIFNAYSTLRFHGGTDPSLLDIAILISNDNGGSWSSAIRLTDNTYKDYDPRVCAANVNDSVVWVFYNRDMGNHEINLYYRYSTDAGNTWSSEETLSADSGVDEYIADIKFYKGFPNYYVNMVYIYDDPAGTPVRKAVRAWTSTSSPTNWRGNQVVNDQDVTPWPEDAAPRIIYSPGAPAPGGGVVFSYYGKNGLYFDAPWNGLMPVPTEQNWYNYAGIETPVINADPADARPMGLGSVATGGSNLDFSISLPGFNEPVDVYLAYYIWPLDPNHLYFITSTGTTAVSLDTFSIETSLTESLRFRSNITEPITWTLPTISVATLPASDYHVFLAVMPHNDVSSYYVWDTWFQH